MNKKFEAVNVLLNDGIALMIYAIASAIARAFVVGSSQVTVLQVVEHAGIELGGSLLIGILAGAVAVPFLRRYRKPDNMFILMVGMTLFITGLANYFHLSVLLVNMSFGIMLTNFSPLSSNKVFSLLKNVSSPLLVAFFIAAGAQLRIDQLGNIWLPALVYLGCYFVGKLSGATLGASIANASTAIRKYIGFGLIPQVGVAVGLVLVVSRDFASLGPTGHEVAMVVKNLILTTCLVTEIAGPIMTRYALIKSGDAFSES